MVPIFRSTLRSFLPTILYNPTQYHRLLSKMSAGPRATSIAAKITNALKPTHLQVINESSMHNVPADAETHFKIVVVSDDFEGKPPLQRHRLVNQLVSDEMDKGLHAISIVTRTPKEWGEGDQKVEASPNCRGGFGK